MNQKVIAEESPPLILTGEQTYQAIIICFLGWLIPGAGHWYQGKYNKGFAFFIMLTGLFLLGMVLHGEIIFPILDMKSQEFNFVNILVFIFGFGNGLMTFLNMTPYLHMGDIAQTSYEVGTLFMVCSGSLNVFAVLNAWDSYRDSLKTNSTGLVK